MYKPKNRNRQKMASRDSAWEISHWRRVFTELPPSLVQIWKTPKLGKERTQSKILAISQHVLQSRCWKSRQGRDALEQKTVVWPWKRKRTKKSLPSKLEQGLNFTMIVDFWFCNGDFYTKTWGKKTWFFSFLYEVKKGHFCTCPNSKSDVLQKRWLFFAFIGYPNLKDILLSAHNWQLTQCSCDWQSCNVLKQCSLLRQVFDGTAVDRLLFYCSFNTRHVALKTWCLSKIRTGWPYAEGFWKLN